MDTYRRVPNRIEGLEPYDPKYLPAATTLSANECPLGLPDEVAARVAARLADLECNRYPDPLANGLRDAIAERSGLARDAVLVGNGGDELLLDTFLAWGGPNRSCLNFPPTFAVYGIDAQITGTRLIDVARDASFDIPLDEALEAIGSEDPDIIIVTSPNNPTGNVIARDGLERILCATDALVVLDEAYVEFADESFSGLVEEHRNLAVLRTFSKAYACAGVRLGYLLADEAVIREYLKVRQPYSVDRISQVIGEEAYRAQDAMKARVVDIRSERERIMRALSASENVKVWGSNANFFLMRVPEAHRIWEALYRRHGVLVRDFSAVPGLEDCLRITVGTKEENDRLLEALAAEI